MTKRMLQTAIAVGLLAVQVSQAQQSPSPSTQPAPQPAPAAQVKPAPCVSPKPVNPSQQIQIKPASRWQKLLDKERVKIENSTGITLPNTSLNDLAHQIQAPAPCPAPAVSPAPASTPASTNPKQ